MPTWTEKLASIGGPELGNRVGQRARLAVLEAKDGFLAFESALSVFPSESLAFWNRQDGWRSLYPNLPTEALCFAADLFGNQFALSGAQVLRLDVETAEVELFAASAEEWARCVLDDYDLHTGYSLAHAWQRAVRPLRPGERLRPNRPFTLGGEYEVSNLSAAESLALMYQFGRFARSLAALPDGTQVEFDERLFTVHPAR